MKKTERRLMTWTSVLVLSASAVFFVRKTDDRKIPVLLERPEIGMITEKIPAGGRIHPVKEVKISPDVSGEIMLLAVKEGDPVRKGDLILKIRQDLYLSMQKRAEAVLKAAQARFRQQEILFRQAASEHQRTARLFEKQAVSELEFENSAAHCQAAREQMDAAAYDIESAAASLTEAEENLARTTVYAPADGIVTNLNIETGERVVGTSQMAGTEMLRIADFRNFQVITEVNENDIIRLSEGDSADIALDAYPGRKFRGKVCGISNSSKKFSPDFEQVTNFEVRIEIFQESYSDLMKEIGLPFRPGMSASVEIETERKEKIITVPLQAVTTRDGKEIVFLYDEKTSALKAVRIQTGIQDLEKIEIRSGITDTLQRIVTGPYSILSKELTDGMKVTPEKNRLK